jgi:hypothetical protein
MESIADSEKEERAHATHPPCSEHVKIPRNVGPGFKIESIPQSRKNIKHSQCEVFLLANHFSFSFLYFRHSWNTINIYIWIIVIWHICICFRSPEGSVMLEEGRKKDAPGNYEHVWTHHKQARKQWRAGTHTRNNGTNEHDWKETAIFLETSINTWGWPIKAETCSGFKDFKSDKCWEHWKVF